MADDERSEDQEQQADEAEQQEPTEEAGVQEQGTAEGAEQEPEEPQETEDAEVAEEAEAAAAEAEMPPLEMNVFDLLRASVGMFAQEAWVGLGIQARPGVGEDKTDLRCARVAIDTLEFLVAKLADEMEDEDKKAFDAELSNLRINYVRLSGSKEQ